MESEAVAVILDRCELDKYELVTSNVIEYEILKILNQDKRDAVFKLTQVSHRSITVNDRVKMQAREFEKRKIKPYDALHLSLAQIAGVDVFLTTDDQILKKKEKLNITFRIMNPLDFIYEELFNE